MARTTERKSERRRYRVIFTARGQVYEIYARSVSQGDLFGFIQVEQILFGQRSSVVVDPSEESLKTEFQGVERFYIPMHSVIRIDEVEKEGVSRIAPASGGETTLSHFPAPVYTPPRKDPGKS